MELHFQYLLSYRNSSVQKGRSLEIANTTVSFSPAAILLNLRTEVAHTLVSRLGKIFKITFLPFKSFREKEDKSVFTKFEVRSYLTYLYKFTD